MAESLAPFIGGGVGIAAAIVGAVFALVMYCQLAEVRGVNNVMLEGDSVSVKSLIKNGGTIALALLFIVPTMWLLLGNVHPQAVMVDPEVSGWGWGWGWVGS